jgi:hypothetical protein
MTPSTLHFLASDTRASALERAGASFDAIVDQQVTDFATAICRADVECEDMIAAIEEARKLAAEERGLFLERVKKAFDCCLVARRVP